MHPPFQAAMVLVRNDKGPAGKMNDFEATASFLFPHDYVASKRTNERKCTADVSEVQATSKLPVGKSGVELRFHTRSEYSSLSDEQRKELSDP